MTDDGEMSWDYTCGSELLGVAINLTISEEQEAILKDNINYHNEMKTFLETCLNKGQKEDEIAASVYFKENKPSKPKASLGKLFGHRSQRHHQSVEEMHEFLKSRIINQQLQEEEPAFNSSVYQSWEEISLHIEKHILFGKHKKSQALVADINLGLLLESGSQIYQREKIMKHVTGTFDKWITNNTDISVHHARRLRALAKALQPFPRLKKLDLTTTEMCNKLSNILKVLEIPEFQTFWSQTT